MLPWDLIDGKKGFPHYEKALLPSGDEGERSKTPVDEYSKSRLRCDGTREGEA